jgi:Flp pilus assembly protein TadG
MPTRGHLHRLLRDAKGAAAVEFAIVGTVFILFLGGILDFGHAWYMRQVVTNASREGARYGVTYKTDSNGLRVAPNAFPSIGLQSIRDYVMNGYLANAILPGNAHPSVTPGGNGYTTGAKGAPLEVTVTATKYWFFLPGFLPGLGDHVNLSATTVMECE